MRGISAIVALVQVITAVSLRAQAPAKGAAQGAWGGNTKGVGHYADVNGIKLYYEIAGTGRPLILLHGGLGALEMFGPNLAALARGRQVIAVDLQGHGRTADIDRPLSVAFMADDIAALIKHLGLASADIMGYSLGGGVALQTAIRPWRRRSSRFWTSPCHRAGETSLERRHDAIDVVHATRPGAAARLLERRPQTRVRRQGGMGREPGVGLALRQ